MLLSQTIKYSIRKGSEIEFSALINILRASDSSEIRSEITYALGYKIKNFKEPIEKKAIQEIKEATNDDIKAEAKSFLDAQIQKQHDIGNGNSWKVSYGKIKLSANYSKKGPQAVITKNQQKTKVNYKNSQSEESTVNILSLADALKNRNKKIKINSNAEIKPTIPDKGGSDLSWYKGTYVTVKDLYNKVNNNGELKSDDKDNYLRSTFSGSGPKYRTDGRLGDLLVDKMVAAIFANVSEKGQIINK